MKYILTLFLLFVAFPASAEVFSWKDPQFNLTMTYPDTWMKQAKEGDQLRVHILAPQGQDHAACRVFANQDNRFLYVPPQGNVEVTQFVQDEKTLQNFLNRMLGYTDVTLLEYKSLGGLGKGPATVAYASYTKEWSGRQFPMQAIVLGGYVRGMETFLHCEALAQQWSQWEPLFMNMASTFDFPAKSAPFKHGSYRDFMADGYVYFQVGNDKGKSRF